MAASETWWKKDEGNYEEWQELTTAEGLTYYLNTDTQETSWEKPDAMLSEAERGDWVWWYDEDLEEYSPALKYGVDQGELILSLNDGREVRVDPNQQLIHLKQSSLQKIVNDLTLLDEMNEPLILHCLKRRFEKAKIYTSIGGIIISINPYTTIEGLYEHRTIHRYRDRLERREKVEPHVFCPAFEAYAKLTFENGKNQSIVISGESGAGKTEAAKQCLSYIGATAGSLAGVEKKVFDANPVLEAFGNAKTIRNNNSSRFGKYVDIDFDQHLKLCGAHTQNYLLEKIRVTNPGDGERNYHIFYFLTGGADRSLKEQLYLSRQDDYHFCTAGNCTKIHDMPDGKEFREVQDAFVTLDFTPDEVMDVYKIVAAILHMGNIQFDEVKHSYQDSTCEVRDTSSAECAADLLSVDPAYLLKQFMNQKIVDSSKELSAVDAQNQKESFCKFVYSKMFDWLVVKINESTKPTCSVTKKIGILDIFGFEIFQVNSLEQLCINFCNEKLQNLFNKTVFEIEERVYKTEGVQVDGIEYIDNGPILEMIEYLPKKGKRKTGPPAGILVQLDEEGKKPGGPQVARYKQGIDDCYSSHSNYKVGRKPMEFVLTHYAGPVSYSVDGFIEKNEDKMNQDLVELANNCENPLMRRLFGGSGMSAKQRKATLSKQFINQLKQLMDGLFKTEPHYIRCVKPNPNKEALTFQSKMCLEQLTYAGVFEAVHIRKEGYPFRLKHGEFVKRYKCILEAQKARCPGGVQGCQKIVTFCDLDADHIKFGRTMVLYRSLQYNELELKRNFVVQQRDLAKNLKEILKTDIASLADQESFFQRVSDLVRLCNRYKFNTPDAEKIRELLEQFIMERMDPETRQLLEEAIAEKDIYKLMEVCEVIEENDYQTGQCQLAVRLRDRILLIQAEATEARQTLDTEHMRSCLFAANEIDYNDENTVRFLELFQLGEGSNGFIKEQIKQAAASNDLYRQLSLEVKIKDNFFKNEAQLMMFNISSYANLKDPGSWAGEKWSLMKGNLADTMMVHVKDTIHTVLTKNVEKNLQSNCCSNFKNIQMFCSDRPVASGQNGDEAGLQVLLFGFHNKGARDEIYCQLMKQIRANDNVYSLGQCWKLINLCLYIFPPSDALENYLEVFIRVNGADKKDETLRNLITTLYNRDSIMRTEPTINDLKEIANGLRKRYNFLEEPPQAPSWVELLTPFDEATSYSGPLPGLVAAPPKAGLSQVNTSNRSRLASMQQPGRPPAFNPGGPAPSPAPAPISGGPPTPPMNTASTGPPSGPPKPPAAPKPPAVPVTEPENYVWVAHLDVESQDLYYYNEATDVTQWDRPSQPVKPFWVARYHETQQAMYYEDLVSGEICWNAPDEYTDELESFIAHKDNDSGDYYYENLETGNVTWDAPECFAGGDSANQWVKHYDKTRRQPYYENLLTGKTTWDQPEGFSAN